MKRNALVWLLACGVLAAGCEDTAETAIDDDVTNRTPYEQLDVAADTAEGYKEEIAAPVVPVQGGETTGGPLTATGNLRGIAADAPPGTIAVTQRGVQSLVSITISRYTVGTELQASITEGSCERPGEVVYTIEEVIRIGPSGQAALNAEVPIPTTTLLNGNHSVRITNPGASPPRADPPEIVLACATLPSANAT